MTDSGLPAAVIDHAASPAQIYCRSCAYEAVDSTEREELDPGQVGDVLICSECGQDIAADLGAGSAESRDGTPAGRGGSA